MLEIVILLRLSIVILKTFQYTPALLGTTEYVLLGFELPPLYTFTVAPELAKAVEFSLTRCFVAFCFHVMKFLPLNRFMCFTEESTYGVIVYFQRRKYVKIPKI